jgi:hypothetical protein
MSLDVYLISETPVKKKPSSGIFVRENGATKEITIEEWNRRYPDSAPVVFNDGEDESNEIYRDNITHNLNPMAEAAGIYNELWRPDEIGITKAKELIDPLREGLHRLKSNPELYKTYNPSNGWGSYEGLVRFVKGYLNACYEYPEATIEADR